VRGGVGGGGGGGGGGTRWSAYFSSGLAISVAMETWPVEHRVFVYDPFVKSGESGSSGGISTLVAMERFLVVTRSFCG